MILLISGSNSFRQKIIKLRTDSLFCSVMNTSLAQLAPDTVWRALLKGGREIEVRKQGQVVYISRKAQASRQWFVVLEGKFRVIVDTESEEQENDSPEDIIVDEEKDVEAFEISTGEVFGGYWIAPSSQPGEVSHVRVKAMESSKILELSGEHLTNLLKDDGGIANMLLSRMGGKILILESSFRTKT